MANADDILGGTLRTKPPSTSSVLVKYPLYLSFALALWLACLWSWNWLKARQEINYRLSMRRKHGIPDDDRRPFNVAYAAVVRIRQQREQEQQKALEEARLRAEMDRERAELEAVAKDEATTTARDLRHPLQSMNFDRAVHPSHPDPQRSFYKRPSYVPTPDPDQLQSQFEDQIQPPRKKKSLRFSESTTIEDHHRTPKRAYESEDNDFGAKKTRVEGEELIDGDETSKFGRRSSKRVLGDDDQLDGSGERMKKRDKKQAAVDGDEDMGDNEVWEVQGPKARGRKRERRVEDEEDHVSDEEDKSRKGRKRRTMQKRKSDITSEKKGKRKRDRDAEVDTDDEGASKRTSRTKRGKKATVEDEKDEGSDVSMDSSVSQDPLCKGRKVGEKWEVNGVKYKVGLNGERLRQTLVKRARSKFIMPQDSQHPDRQANLEVFIETWLTDEAYKQAKDRQELAWQISPTPSTDPSPVPSPLTQTTSNIPQPETPTKKVEGGKNLLWSSTASTRSASTYNLPRLSLPSYTSRRVSSAFVPINHLAMSGTSGKQGAFRSFSKWEKQDLEAEAMRKMRAKLEEQKKAEAAKNTPPPSAPQLSSSISAPAASGFSLPKPDNKPTIVVTPPSATSNSFSSQPPVNPAPTSTSSASTTAPANSLSFPKLAEKPGNQPAATPSITFGPPSTSVAPSGLEKSALTVTSTSNPSNSGFAPIFPATNSFSLPKPSQPQQSTPASSGFFGLPSAATPAPASSSNAVSSTPAAPQNPKPSFSFSAGGQSTTPVVSNAPATSPFAVPSSIPAPPSSIPAPWVANKPQIQSQSSSPASAFSIEQKKPEQTPSGGGLLSRVGGFAASNSSQIAEGSQRPSNPTSATFTPSIPNPPTTTPQTTPAQTAPPKFNFGSQSKPANASASPNSWGSNTTTVQKPTPSFTFEPSTSGGGAASNTTAPKFSFGFGKTNSTAGGTGESGSSNPTVKPFGSFGSGFSTTPAGSPATEIRFGGGNAAASGSGDQGKSSSMFGGGNNATTEASQQIKPTLAFGTSASSTPSTTVNTQNKPGAFTFQFGSTPGASTSPFGVPANKSDAPPSSFPQPSNSIPNPFGFGTSSSTNTGQNQQQK